MKSLAKLISLVLVGTMVGCASVSKVESGDQAVGQRLTVHLEGAWNQISAPGIAGPNCYVWTMEGLPVDQLWVYSGVKNDEAVHADPPAASANKKIYKFRSDMQPDQIIALFEGMLTRDGSTFKLTRQAPASFGAAKGFEFEYSLVRKTDNVQLYGMGGVVVSKGELFAIIYQAPRLVFYPRHKAEVSHIIASARLRES